MAGKAESASHQITDVPLISQLPELVRGCEVTSLAMLLNYNGYEVNKMELAQKIKKEPFQQGKFKGNMHQGFVGNMQSLKHDGLGVYVEPIIDLAKQYVNEDQIVNLTGKAPEDLYQAVEKGLPVWVIINARYKELPPDQFETWQTEEGTIKVTYRQHSSVITGFDEEYVYVNDPLKKEKNVRINRKNFEQAWIQMGRQALTFSNSADPFDI
ncbi:C39 family peptidase [Bacillus xiapuensis]|uniref:C39 family peptidase n=1 Tax=Bacillus xiapuensis TaxID=2014075 RepID=UPI001E397ED8|nr:C39 family peptidase [Bacillus xiapuensis]